jgi:biopolymer transport protein ExbD
VIAMTMSLKSTRGRPVAAINITPLIDVMADRIGILGAR